MHANDLMDVEQWFLPFGPDNAFWRINKHTVIYTWVCLVVIAAFVLVCRRVLKKKEGMGRFITLSFVEFFIDLVGQTLPQFTFNNLVFIATLFSFILMCNVISVVPWMGEPTTDLNTTLGLGLVSFIYIQYSGIIKHGLWQYIKSYFSPFFLMFPMHVVGKLASIVSISFRLFGNIVGGSIISSIYLGTIQGVLFFEVVGLFTGLNMLIYLFFGVFEGFLQAFVFSMLSLTYLSLAQQEEGH